jgi:hypothetical protein
MVMEMSNLIACLEYDADSPPDHEKSNQKGRAFTPKFWQKRLQSDFGCLITP